MNDLNNRFDPLTLGKRAQRIRNEKGISIECLAKEANVNKNTVVRFEKGISTRMETIYKICNVLGVSPFELIEGKLVKERDYAIKKHIVHPSEAKHVSRSDRVPKDHKHGMKIGDLEYQLPGGQMTAKVLEISECGQIQSHPGEELVFCLTGKVGIKLSEVEAVLNKGDAIFFWGTEPHCYFNADKEKTVSVALSVVCGKDTV